MPLSAYSLWGCDSIRCSSSHFRWIRGGCGRVGFDGETGNCHLDAVEICLCLCRGILFELFSGSTPTTRHGARILAKELPCRDDESSCGESWWPICPSTRRKLSDCSWAFQIQPWGQPRCHLDSHLAFLWQLHLMALDDWTDHVDLNDI